MELEEEEEKEEENDGKNANTVEQQHVITSGSRTYGSSCGADATHSFEPIRCFV